MFQINLDFGRVKPEFIHQNDARFQSKHSINQLSILLLEYLKEQLHNDTIYYKSPLQRFYKGFERLMFEFHLGNISGKFSNPLILRLFQEDIPIMKSCYESIIQNSITKLDFPAPQVLHFCEEKKILGGSFMLMERLDGKNLSEYANNHPSSLFKLPRILARIQIKLHSLEPEIVISSLEKHGFDTDLLTMDGFLENISNRIDESSLDNYVDGLTWLKRNKPDVRKRKVICHLDLHFGNILIKDGKITGVVDWGQTMFGEPELDISSTNILLDRIYRKTSYPFQMIAGIIRRYIIWQYYMEYTRYHSLDPFKLRYYGALLSFSNIIRLVEFNAMEKGYGWILKYHTSNFAKYTKRNVIPSFS